MNRSLLLNKAESGQKFEEHVGLENIDPSFCTKLIACHNSSVLIKENNKVYKRTVLTGKHVKHLLCFGFVRSFLPNSINPSDIVSIVIKYFGVSSSCVVTFKGSNRPLHSNQMILFRHNPSAKHTISIHITKLTECNDYTFGKGGYWLQFGIIRLPYNVLNDIIRKNLLNDICSMFQHSFGKDGHFGTFKKSMTKLFGATPQHAIDSFVIKDELETYYMQFGYQPKLGRYFTTFGCGMNWNYISLYDKEKDTGYGTVNADCFDPNYCLKQDDRITFNFEKINETNNKGNRYYLSFVRNDDIVVGKDVLRNNFKYGRFELDLDKYVYCFGFASKCCHCKNIKRGFEYEISCV